MSLTNLNLVRHKIESTIKEFIGEKGRVIVTPPAKGNLFIHKISIPSQAEATLNVYYNKSGSTSLVADVGKNRELSAQVANHVKEKCSLKELKVRTLYIKSLRQEDFDAVLEFLKSESDAKVEDGSNLVHGKQYKVTGKQGDVLFFNYFNNGSFQVQGSPRLLFHETIEILSELLPFKDVIEQQIEYYSLNLTANDVLGELANRMPTAYGEIKDKIKAIISPSLALLKLQDELTDFSVIAYPVLRGLEGVLHQILLNNGQVISRSNKLSTYFDIDVNTSRLSSRGAGLITDSKSIVALNKIYFYYQANRHILFHMDGMVDSSRTLTRAEAEDIINKSLNLIEDSFVTLSN